MVSFLSRRCPAAASWRSLGSMLVGLLLGLANGGLPTCTAQHEPTQLLSLSRSGGQSGSSFELRVATGNHLVEIDSLHFSNPDITAELKTLDPLPFTEDRLPQHGHFVVTLPGDLATGRYDVRASGRNGVSNPRAFLVSNLPNELPGQVSHDFASPTPLAIGTLLHAKSTAAEVDFYQIRLTKEQPLQLEILAQQLDSRLIGHLKLFDAEGREIASARGGDDFDPSLQTPKELAPGDYVLAVHDFLYRGGEEYHYQVLARPVEQATSLIQPSASVPGQLPSVWAVRAFTSVNEPSLESSTITEHAPDPSSVIELPFVSTQRFPKPPGEAVFRFNANEGDTLAIDVRSQRGGYPTDARLTVQRIESQASADPKLHEVATIDDCQNVTDGAVHLFSTDPVALVKVPATAEYQLAIRDLDIGQSLAAGKAFQLSIGPPQPGYDLVAYRQFPQRDANQTQPFGSRIFRGGTEQIRVFVVRRDGWNGAVKVRCEGLPDGVTSSEAVIAPNQTQTQLLLTAAEDAAGNVTPVRVVGQSEDGSLERQAVAATIQWGKGAGRDFIQSRLTSDLWVAVSEQDTAPLSISLGDGNVAEIRKGQSLKLPVKLVRREGGQAACTARPRDLPGGVSIAELAIPAEKSEGEIEIKVDPGTQAGTYSLWLQVETKIKFKPNPQALERAQRYRSHLQTLHDDPAQAANLDAIKAAIAEADKRVEAAKGAAQDKELTVFLPSSNASIRVVEP